MIYLNQAATTYPKPKTVTEAVEQAMALPPSSQFRAPDVSSNGDDIFSACKGALGQLFGIRDYDRIVLTSGATDSMNRIVRGLPFSGAQLAVTQAEHNAVLRCVYNIPKEARADGNTSTGGNTSAVRVIACDETGHVRTDALRDVLGAAPHRKANESAGVLFVNHCSNVTGAVNDLKAIAEIAHENGWLLAADVSQSAGVFPIDVAGMGIDILCFTGHKGLYGPQGTGGYYARAGVPLLQTVFGGTGTNSAQLFFSEQERRTEAHLRMPGTQNAPGAAGLLAGVRFVEETGLSVIYKKERALLNRLSDGLRRIAEDFPRAGLRVYCAGEAPVLSFTLGALPPQDVGYLLAHGYGITVRTGLHCAPLVHEALGTLPNGTVRISLSYFNCAEEIDAFLAALQEIAEAVVV